MSASVDEPFRRSPASTAGTATRNADDTDPGNAQVFTWPFQEEVDPDTAEPAKMFQGFGVVFAEKKADDEKDSYVLRRAFRPKEQPVRWYRDKFTGKTMDRPGFNRGNDRVRGVLPHF